MLLFVSTTGCRTWCGSWNEHQRPQSRIIMWCVYPRKSDPSASIWQETQRGNQAPWLGPYGSGWTNNTQLQSRPSIHNLLHRWLFRNGVPLLPAEEKWCSPGPARILCWCCPYWKTIDCEVRLWQWIHVRFQEDIKWWENQTSNVSTTHTTTKWSCGTLLENNVQHGTLPDAWQWTTKVTVDCHCSLMQLHQKPMLPAMHSENCLWALHVIQTWCLTHASFWFPMLPIWWEAEEAWPPCQKTVFVGYDRPLPSYLVYLHSEHKDGRYADQPNYIRKRRGKRQSMSHMLFVNLWWHQNKYLRRHWKLKPHKRIRNTNQNVAYSPQNTWKTTILEWSWTMTPSL